MALGYIDLLAHAASDGTALTNSTTATSLLPAHAKWNMPAGWAGATPGRKLLLRATGRISTVVTTPGTLTLAFRLGPTSNIVAATSQAFALNTVAKTNTTWTLDLLMTVRAVGSSTSANIMANGVFASEAVIGSPLQSAGGIGSLPWQASAPAVGTGWDSTVANIADLYATWSVANAANSIQLHDFALVSLN
jgi:hypothetical protein